MSGLMCNCGLCRPDSNKNPHPKYGYDLNAVPGCICLICKEYIGQEKYIEVTPLARFGQMFFIHERCDKGESHGNQKAENKK